jgi:hypothetical protein
MVCKRLCGRETRQKGGSAVLRDANVQLAALLGLKTSRERGEKGMSMEESKEGKGREGREFVEMKFKKRSGRLSAVLLLEALHKAGPVSFLCLPLHTPLDHGNGRWLRVLCLKKRGPVRILSSSGATHCQALQLRSAIPGVGARERQRMQRVRNLATLDDGSTPC